MFLINNFIIEKDVMEKDAYSCFCWKIKLFNKRRSAGQIASPIIKQMRNIMELHYSYEWILKLFFLVF